MSENSAEMFMQENRKMWDEFVAIHARSPLYELEPFKKGVNKLNPLELSEVGEVTGKSLLHLQCHFGMDTLSWARHGATVTGMDYAEKAITLARQLAEELHIPARFICCNLYVLPQNLEEQFDVVYTSYGVLCWLNDIRRWAQIAASYVKPGGFFYISEFHPFAMVFDDEADALRYRYPYFQEEAMSFEVKGSYADRNAKVEAFRDFEWQHTLGEIVTSLIDAGLQIEFLHEHPFTVYEQLPFLQADGKGYWHFPEGQKPIPLMFSLKAIKP
jgi:2-polyprenyl-3-methyl-5-hydroxy-6-metoxy-1,4-benzoquinol methylase